MTNYKSFLFNGKIWFRTATKKSLVFVCFKNYFKELILLFSLYRHTVIKSRSSRKSVQNFVRKTSTDCCITFMQFSPTFLQNDNPNFLSPWSLCKKRLVFGIYRYKVINNNLLQDTTMQYFGHIDSIFLDLETWENIFNSVVFFC